MNKHEILFIIGTRPELIKIAPVIMALEQDGYSNFAVVNTGQHRDLLHKYWEVFNIQPDYNLELILPNQDLSSLTVRAVAQISGLINTLKQKGELPKVILAQGDTTTVMAASIVAFYFSIKFVHLEAGLRSHDLQQPFPEEFNRRIASITAYLHLAPTQLAKENLLRENVNEKSIHVIGNTVLDSLEFIRKTEAFRSSSYNDPVLGSLKSDPTVLITCHRRENHGENLLQIIGAIENLATRYKNFQFVWLLHPNPNVKQVVTASSLTASPNFLVTDPLDYWDLLKLLSRSVVVITDSGGIQEEAPSFGKPVIVLREVTERPEAVVNGMAKLAGADAAAISDAFEWALQYNSAGRSNPYGDGLSGRRVASLLLGITQPNYSKLEASQRAE